MKRSIALTLFAALLVSTSVALASGSSGGSLGSPSAERAHAVTVRMKCKIVKIDGEADRLLVKDVKSGHEHVVTLSDATKIRAQNKAAFDGRKKLDFSDLEAGQHVFITHKVDTHEVLAVKVLAATA